MWRFFKFDQTFTLAFCRKLLVIFLPAPCHFFSMDTCIKSWDTFTELILGFKDHFPKFIDCAC